MAPATDDVSIVARRRSDARRGRDIRLQREKRGPRLSRAFCAFASESRSSLASQTENTPEYPRMHGDFVALEGMGACATA